MHKKNISFFIKDEDPKLRIEIKKIFKLKYDLKVLDWEEVFLTEKNFLELKKLAILKWRIKI